MRLIPWSVSTRNWPDSTSCSRCPRLGILAAAVVHKTLYAIGGSNGTRALDTVEVADLDSRNSKLRWSDAGKYVADGTHSAHLPRRDFVVAARDGFFVRHQMHKECRYLLTAIDEQSRKCCIDFCQGTLPLLLPPNLYLCGTLLVTGLRQRGALNPRVVRVALDCVRRCDVR